MSAELLRRAAALMRERAEAATPGPWIPVIRPLQRHVSAGRIGVARGSAGHGRREWLFPMESRGVDVEHIASWDPAVALTVADWLDHEARFIEECVKRGQAMPPQARLNRSLAVARAYLGEPS